MRPRPTIAAALLLALAGSLPGTRPARAGEVEEAKVATTAPDAALDVVRGRLLVRKSKAGERHFEIAVGKTTYRVRGGNLARAPKLLRKFVSAGGRLEGPAKSPSIRLGKKTVLEEQTLGPVLGTVVPAGSKKGVFELRGEKVTYSIPRKHASKFKAFVGKHVAAEAFVLSAPGSATLESVKSVVRSLLPGEREPASGEEALAGAWTGELVVARVPGGVPHVKKGDTFPLLFTTDAGLNKTRGRLMRTYSVVDTRLRKFRHKQREVDFELSYSFGQGNHALRLIGTFSEDWKTFTGKWTTSFVGSGTLELTLRNP